MSRDIPIILIDRDEDQPRQHFDQAALDELAQSIAANGLAVPILVRPEGERYVIVHGERRWRACQQIGWATIPAEIRDISPDEAHWLALVENVQRADLSPIEEARAYQARIAEGITQEALGRRIGKSQSYIAQKLRLLTLPDPVLVLLDRKAITEGHARQLLRLRAMYHEMTCTFTPDAGLYIGAIRDALRAEGRLPDDPSFLDDYQEILLFYLSLRLEDQPASGLWAKDDRELALLRDVCNTFGRYVLQHNCIIPLWGLAAFWWGSLAAHLSWTVVELNTFIDCWHERFLSAIYWKIVYQGEMKHEQMDTDQPFERRAPYHQMRWLEYWGFMSDLRHGRILEYLDSSSLPSALLDETIAWIKQRKFVYALPTQLQPYGPHHKRYTELQTQYDTAFDGDAYVS